MKNKKYILLFFVLNFVILKLNAQNKPIKIQGFVKYDAVYLQDINIINKKSNFGASSDTNGNFTLYAKKGDSILFSSIVYEDRIIKISDTHINSKSISVYLEPDYYQLDEVMLDKKVFIGWENASVTKGTIFNNDEISNNKAPNARKLTDPNANAGGLNPIALFMMLTKKARLRKKDRKLKLKRIEQLKVEFPTTIKNLYGAVFFKEVLYISEDKIYLFLDYCEGNGLNNFYDNNEIVVKNFLIKQARVFNSIKN